MADVKFSQFTSGGEIRRGDIVVGLRPSSPTENFQFDFPGLGIQDANGNFMFQYATTGLSAVNFPILTNALTGSSVIYGANGADSDIPIWIRPAGTAGVRIDDLNFPISDGVPGAVMTTDGFSNLSLNAISTLIQVQGTANQVLVNGTFGTFLTGNLTLTTPQDIAPISNVAFNSLTLTTPLSLSSGGTNSNLTASNGGIVYSNASALQILGGTPTANQMLQSGASAAPTWSTATWPATTTINQILYSSAANIVTGLPTANSAMLYTNSSGIPAFSMPMSNGQLMIGATGASPMPATLTAGTGMVVTNGPNSITLSQAPGGETWTDVTATSQNMSADNGYTSNNASLVTLTLPITAVYGTFIDIIGKGAGGWKIAQNAGQNIQIGTSSTTVGVGGSVSSTNRFDSIRLICTTANTTWTAHGAPQSSGLTIV